MKVQLRIADILALTGGELVGDDQAVVTGLNGVDLARAGDLTFVDSDKYLPLLKSTLAAVVLVRSAVSDCRATQVVVAEPNVAFNRILAKVVDAADRDRLRGDGGVHPSATVHPSAKVDSTAAIGAQAVICPGASIGPRSVVGPLTYVGHGSTLGADCILHPGAVVMHGVTLGDRVTLQPNCVVGSDGFGYAKNDRGHYEKIPQVGGVLIGDDVEIGSSTTIDRGRFAPTRIGRGTKIDNLVQVAHNVILGEDCILVAHCGVAGSSELGDRVTIGAMTGVTGHIKIGNDVGVAAMSGVSKGLDPGQNYLGIPAKPILEGSKIRLSAEKLPALLAKVRELEQRLAKLESASSQPGTSR